MSQNVFHTPNLVCPTCKNVLDASIATDNSSHISDDDISLCFTCLSVNKFTNNCTELKSCDISELDYDLQVQVISLREFIINNQCLNDKN